MKSYLTDPRVVNGFATTDLFRENMELVADTSLTEFFNDWIFGEGYPIYDVDWSYANQQVKITIYQEPSVSNGPFFDMKLPISITVNGKEETYWLHNTQQGQQFSIAVPATPDSVVFNKALWILCKEANFHTGVSSLQSPEIFVHYNASEKYITANLPASEQAEYSIFDLQGRKITSGVWKKGNPVISVAQFKQGIYIVAFSTPHKTCLSRFSCY
jgi:hypothetical protein